MPKLQDLIFKRGKKNEENDQATGEQQESSAQLLGKGMMHVRDIIAPSAIEVDFNHIKVGSKIYRTLFVSGYPRFVGANWLAPIINFEHDMDLSMFYYPVSNKGILDDLRRKITELEATMRSDADKGRIVDPQVAVALDDAKALQDQLVKGAEKFFQFSFYITIPGDTLEEIENVTSKLESTLASLLLISKKATLQMEEAFQTSIPTAMDKLMVTRNMDTTSLATTFPFTSSNLTQEDGIMYGINRNNGSLIIFDRFTMQNANTVVFAASGAGKSYAIKLEALRSMVFGTEVIIIDPEEEYRSLCEAVGGEYISFAANSPSSINPFDLSGVAVEGENELGQKILSLHSLFKLMLGDLNSTEEAILDRALIETYRIKNITTDPDSQMNNEPPVMEDLYKVLLGFIEPEAKTMAERLERYIRGSLAGIFDSQSTIDFNSRMIVFSTKNLEDVLRPIAFYIILDFVWTKIRKDLKRRILIVEEAWYLLQNEDSAKFIYGIAKRARKYYLGLTTITQDVADFMRSDYGKAIVTNSAIQLLLKQAPAAIEDLAQTFYLSEGEKRLLLGADLGEGLFFAGPNHVAIKVQASAEEHKLITTNPQELLKYKEEREREKAKNIGMQRVNERSDSGEIGLKSANAAATPQPEIQDVPKNNQPTEVQIPETETQQTPDIKDLTQRNSIEDLLQDAQENAQKEPELEDTWSDTSRLSAAIKQDTPAQPKETTTEQPEATQPVSPHVQPAGPNQPNENTPSNPVPEPTTPKQTNFQEYNKPQEAQTPLQPATGDTTDREEIMPKNWVSQMKATTDVSEDTNDISDTSGTIDLGQEPQDQLEQKPKQQS